MMTKGQGLGFLGAGLIFLLGALLSIVYTRPGNLHYSGLAFLFVGLALFTGTLTSWLNERHHRTSLLAIGLGLALPSFSSLSSLASGRIFIRQVGQHMQEGQPSH